MVPRERQERLEGQEQLDLQVREAVQDGQVLRVRRESLA